MSNLQRERDNLEDIIREMEASSNPVIDRDTFLIFANQVLKLMDDMLYSINQLCS